MVRKLDKLGCRASHTAELKFNGVRVPGGNLLGGQEKLEHKLAKAREAIEGATHSGSATLGTFEQTRPWWPPRRSELLGLPWNTPPSTRTGAKRSVRRSSTTRASRFRWPTWPPRSTRRGCSPGERRGWPPRGCRSSAARARCRKLAASEVAVRTTERAIQTMGGWGYITDHPVEKWYRDAKLYTIFEGTSEIQRIVISNALGAADGTPPLHVDLEPTGGPLNKMFGRGTPARTQLASSALAAKDRIPHPVMQLAMKVLRPPSKPSK